jgi:heavy metal sensor kinase
MDAGRPVWYFDRDHTEEAFIVRRLQRIFLLTDGDGRVLEVSDLYSKFGIESPQAIRRMLRSAQPILRTLRAPDGNQYLVRAGTHYDENRREYFMAIGRALNTNEQILRRFTIRYFTIVPVLILVLCAAGWLAAGRALRPLNAVAEVAHSVTGDKLHLRIPRREADDELDHLIETFNSMVDRLQNSFNQMRQFSIDVSHELRTPLTAVRGQLEVALMTAETTDQYRDAIYDAIADVERLSNVVRALLHLSQAESGQLTLAQDPVSLAAVARGAVERLGIVADSKSIRLASQLDEQVMVLGDRIQLERLVSNLLTNAIKYTPEGGAVRVEVAKQRRLALLAVEDSGCGIAAEHLPHIFDRLFRVPDGRQDLDRGLGLGLSFVAWIVKAHNGRIRVDSKPGQGSRFEVTLPLLAGVPAPSEERPAVPAVG